MKPLQAKAGKGQKDDCSPVTSPLTALSEPDQAAIEERIGLAADRVPADYLGRTGAAQSSQAGVFEEAAWAPHGPFLEIERDEASKPLLGTTSRSTTESSSSDANFGERDLGASLVSLAASLNSSTDGVGPVSPALRSALFFQGDGVDASGLPLKKLCRDSELWRRRFRQRDELRKAVSHRLAKSVSKR
jgi:hypothetical protein